MKRRVGWYRRISQALRLPLAGPLFRLYAPRRRWPMARQSTRPRILIANLMPSLGDTICYMALAEAIRDALPAAEITWMADGAVAAFVAKHPDVDHVLTIKTPPSRLSALPVLGSYYRAFQMVRSVQSLPLEERYDVAIVPRGGIDPSFSAQAAWVMNLPVVGGYSHLLEPTDIEHSYPDTLFTHVEKRIIALHESARSIYLLSLIDLVPDAVSRFNVKSTLRGLHEIAQALDAAPLLDKAGLPTGASFIILAPFAGAPRKEWPKFRELAQRLIRETDRHVLVIGTRKDFALTQTICAGLGERIHNSAGLFNLQELTTVIYAASAFVGNDSGAGHVAGALGIATISLHVQAMGADAYHKGSPEQHMPLGPHVTVLRPHQFLPGCELRCESETAHCIAQITVREVWEALEDALK